MNVLKLMKSLKTMGPDEALELLASMGVKLELTPIPLETKPATAELEAIAGAAVAEGNKFLRVNGDLKGIPVTAFVVLGKPQEDAHSGTRV